MQVTFGYRVFRYSDELSRGCQFGCQDICYIFSSSRHFKFWALGNTIKKGFHAGNRVNRVDKYTPVNLKGGTMARKERFCNKHGMSHFPPTGKKCPGPEFSEISLSGEIRGDVKMQVAATATVCSQLQKVAILLCQFRLI